MASCTFLYQPKTHGISEALLAEADRTATAARESAAEGPSISGSSSVKVSIRTRTACQPLLVGDSEAALNTYQLLMRAGRYTEAEQLARQAKHSKPENPTLELMVERRGSPGPSQRTAWMEFPTSPAKTRLSNSSTKSTSRTKSSRDWQSIQSRGDPIPREMEEEWEAAWVECLRNRAKILTDSKY